MLSKFWRGIRRKRLNLDKNTCQRCRTYHRWGRTLTVHHIVPRPIGKENMGNLITLCDPCHNAVEGRGYTRYEVMHYFPSDIIVNQDVLEEEDDWRDIDWRIRVYGGIKDIKFARQIMAEKISSS